MSRLRTIFSLAVALTTAATTSWASTHTMNHGAMNHGSMGQGSMMDHGSMEQDSMMDHGSMGQDTTDHSSMDHSDFDLGPADDDFDLRFIDAMIPHHEGAVAMAEQALTQSERSEIIALAEAIVATQAVEIEQLQTWRQDWYPDAQPQPHMWNTGMNHMMTMGEAEIAAMRMDMPLGEADPEFDRRFLEAMIPHHEGAVVMADAALARSQRPEMQTLATSIREAQAAEISQMQAWLSAWYGIE